MNRMLIVPLIADFLWVGIWYMAYLERKKAEAIRVILAVLVQEIVSMSQRSAIERHKNGN